MHLFQLKTARIPVTLGLGNWSLEPLWGKVSRLKGVAQYTLYSFLR